MKEKLFIICLLSFFAVISVAQQPHIIVPDSSLITTEKDSVRLASVDSIPEELRPRFLYIPIEVRFLNSGDNQFNKQIVEYVTANKRNGIIH